MSNYIKAVDFNSKDSLTSGNPLKIIKGSEINNEFNAIQTAVATKADLASPDFIGNPTAPTQPYGNNSTRLATTAFAIANGFPSGGIIMWSGSLLLLPSGFNLCDGTNGTPDLRNRFIVGAGSTYTIGNTGGSKDSVVVSHTHTIVDPGHAHAYKIDNNIGQGDDGGLTPQWIQQADATTGTSTTGISINSSGVSGVNANLPPYFALAYIMKL